MSRTDQPKRSRPARGRASSSHRTGTGIPRPGPLLGPNSDATAEVLPPWGRPAAPVWQRFAKGEVSLWEATLRGSVEDVAQWGQLSEKSIGKQQTVVDELLGLGEGVLDGTNAEILSATAVAQEWDNFRFHLTCLMSSSVQRSGRRLRVQLGALAPSARDSLGTWVWRNLVRPWLPEGRRRLDTGYRRTDARVWAGGLWWLLGFTGRPKGDSFSLYLPAVARCGAHRGGSAHGRGDSQMTVDLEESAVRAFAQAVQRVARGQLAVRREMPLWDPEGAIHSRLRCDNPLRNDPQVRHALNRAYVALGGDERGVTGRAAPLLRLAILLAAIRPLLWPAAVRRDDKGTHHRDLKLEANRLRRELGLRGRPRRKTR